jgi:pyrroline-5-carboxylate reductase
LENERENHMHKVSFIGGGNMAAAIIGGLVASGADPAGIEVVEINADARANLAARFGVVTHADLSQARLHGLVVLAVKPQSLPEVAAVLSMRMAGQLVLSIAAGVRVADLARWLGGHARIVRAMPNTPALVRAGVSGLYAAPGLSADARSDAEAVLRAVGGVVWVDDETALDAVTAVSGSGPAYVFYCIESLEAAAAAAGLAPAAARQLALQTFFGAAKLALESGEEPAVLRQRVTSKGGTTERGLAALDAANVKAAFAAAVNAASRRSAELGDELGRLA